MVYAVIHVRRREGNKDFEVRDDKELGNALNYFQGLIWDGLVEKVTVTAIDEAAHLKADLFNQYAGTLMKQESTSKIIRGVK